MLMAKGREKREGECNFQRWSKGNILLARVGEISDQCSAS